MTLQVALEQAFAAVEQGLDKPVLLGIMPERLDDGLGWIVPQTVSHEITPVTLFREKPSLAEAEALRRTGALVNSFIFVARGLDILRLVANALPALAGAFESVLAGGCAMPGLETLYAGLPSYDLSGQVFESSPQELCVLRVPPCGWSDLGTPERVARCLAGLAASTVVAKPRPLPRPDGDVRRPWNPPVVLADRVAWLGRSPR